MAQPSVSSLKSKIRKKARKFKISVRDRLLRSLKACVEIEKMPSFKKAKTIGFYAALEDEMDLMPLASRARALGKKIFFPRVVEGEIEFREVRDLENDFHEGKWGIWEPNPESTAKRERELDLLFVPGRAFDARGNRVGRGGGFYDRLLFRWKKGVRIGVCFREQLIASVPCEAHDAHVSRVLVF
jgi:5-formyltetrahydrofolate cyclo-ligase